MKLKSLLKEFGPGYSPQYPGGSKKSVSQMAMSIAQIEKKAWQAGIKVEMEWDDWAEAFLEDHGVGYWGDLEEDDLQVAYEEALAFAKKHHMQVTETVLTQSTLTESEAPLYKDWDEFVNPDYIMVHLNDGRKMQISKRNVAGGTRMYRAILHAFNDNRTDVTNKIVSAMSSMLDGTLKSEAVDTGAYRRLVITSPKVKQIQDGAEKFMEQYSYLYPDLTFNVIESPKPNTIVIDLIGNKATVVGIKFEDLAKKLDKTATVVVRKEKKLGK